jgi:RNA polymerase sigma-70 factor, ECF subfamily
MVQCPESHLPSARRPLDVESRLWVERLHGAERTRGRAVAELHERLRREAAFQIRDRVRNRAEFPKSDIDDLATEAADNALMVLLRKLDEYRGESKFWTWARKFAALEAPVSIRRRVGHDRVGISPNPDLVFDVPDPARSAQELLEIRELLHSVSEIIATRLTNRQRIVLIATAVNGVSPQTLAGELHTTPGAIHKLLHDARVKLRLNLAAETAAQRGSGACSAMTAARSATSRRTLSKRGSGPIEQPCPIANA